MYTKKPSAFCGCGKLTGKRYDMMSRLLRTREFGPGCGNEFTAQIEERQNLAQAGGRFCVGQNACQSACNMASNLSP
jgi:hypothetical protein